MHRILFAIIALTHVLSACVEGHNRDVEDRPDSAHDLDGEIIPAREPFHLTNRLFSVGAGCTGITYSEYEHVVTFGDAEVRRIFTSLDHGGGGDDGLCAVEFTETESGSFVVDGLRVRLDLREFVREESLLEPAMALDDGTTTDCSGTRSLPKDIDKTVTYTMAYCTGRDGTVPGLLADSGEPQEFWALREVQ